MSPVNLQYSGVDLDRQASLRKDPDWVNQQLERPDSLFLPVWQSKNLISGSNKKESPSIIYLNKDKYLKVQEYILEIVFLGLDSGRAIFTCNLSNLNQTDLESLFVEGDFIDLRRIGQSMNGHEAARLAYARGIIHWHKNHLFCSKCGSRSISKNGGHMRLCSNDGCGKETFPRTDPAVIMLVEHISESGVKRCLLGRHAKSPEGAYSTLAGFVDPGESLEEAVIREVNEEAGVHVGEVLYQGSQPWPFPASIMLGFRAQAKTEQIVVDPDELIEARWFTVKDLLLAGEWGDNTSSLKISRKDSIARYLINSWINDNS